MMKNTIKIISVIIGTMIGAGFASGTEIFLFFGSFGFLRGIAGMVFSCIFTTFLIYRVLIFIYENPIYDYTDFLSFLFPKKWPFLKNVTNIIIDLFLLFSFFIMVSGFGAYFEQEFGFSRFLGIFLILLLCYITFRKKTDGLTKVNSLLIPLLIFFTLWLGIQALSKITLSSLTLNLTNRNSGFWLLDSLLYSSYNSILLIPILITLKPFLEKKQTITKVSILSGFLLLLLSFAIYAALLTIDIDINTIEIPTLYIAGTFGNLQKFAYGLTILTAIFTSAVSAGFSFLKTFENSKFLNLLLLLMAILSFIISSFSFSSLVSLLYPIFGYLGILQILALLLKKTPKTDIK